MPKWICDRCKSGQPCILEDIGGGAIPSICPWGISYLVDWRPFEKNKKTDITNGGFMPGDTVTWTSQASGITKTKTGKVVWVLFSKDVKEGLNPRRVAKNWFNGHSREFKGYCIPGRAAKGYLVEVITGPNSKPKLYMPYPSKLTLSVKD